MENEDLSGTSWRQVLLRDARLKYVDLTGARLDKCDLSRVRMRGVDIVDTEIDGDVQHLVINGVDVAPLVEAPSWCGGTPTTPP